MQVLNIFHVLIAIALIAFVLIQKGQGATAGAAFGSGASGTVFGSRGAGNFLSRSTWVLAALFCAISLTMAVMVSRLMTTPEADLGVVSVEQPAAEIEDSPQFDEITVGPDEPTVTDMPSFDQGTDAATDSSGVNSSTAEDLPVLDDSADEESPAAGNGEDRPGQGTDDS